MSEQPSPDLSAVMASFQQTLDKVTSAPCGEGSRILDAAMGDLARSMGTMMALEPLRLRLATVEQKVDAMTAALDRVEKQLVLACQPAPRSSGPRLVKEKSEDDE